MPRTFTPNNSDSVVVGVIMIGLCPNLGMNIGFWKKN